MIKIGTESENVKNIQRFLYSKGYYKGDIDGVFGIITEKAVKEFQKELNLEVDGIVGPETLSIIEKLRKENIRKIYSNLNKNSIIKPIFLKNENEEDFEDPEFIGNDIEEKEEEVTCKNSGELINYIRSCDIKRNIDFLVVHCTATSPNASVSGIENYWKNTLGWRSPGYHILIKPSGEFTVLSDFNNVTNGVRNYNSRSIHISYIGGIDSNSKPLDTRTEEQELLIKIALKELKEILPDVTIMGHNDFPGVTKACPSFDAQFEYKNI